MSAPLTLFPAREPTIAQIGHIEIRCEDSLDLRQYVHKKDIQEKITPVEGDLLTIRDGLVELMKPDVKRMCDLGVIYHPDPAQLKPFACQCAQRRLQPNQKWAWAILSRLRIFAQALQYLLEQTITACLDELGKNVSDKGNKKDGELQRLIDQIKKLQGIQGYVIHPKVDLLRSMLIEHFTNDETGDTRVMVFCSYRGVVEELVASLNEQQPLIRATRFVGQSADKKGGKGFTQVEQRKVRSSSPLLARWGLS